MENPALEVKVSLEPSGLGRPGGEQLLNVLPNTVAVYQKIRYRSWDEVKADKRLDELVERVRRRSRAKNGDGDNNAEDDGCMTDGRMPERHKPDEVYEMNDAGPGTEPEGRGEIDRGNGAENGTIKSEMEAEFSDATEMETTILKAVERGQATSSRKEGSFTLGGGVEGDNIERRESRPAGGPRVDMNDPLRLSSSCASDDDEVLNNLEEELFRIQDASNRQLYLDTLREETDIFLIFADWAEKQRRKIYDPQLRNVSEWMKVDRMKQSATDHLSSLIEIFRLLKNPPLGREPWQSGTVQGRTERVTESIRRRHRQLLLFSSLNDSNRKLEFQEIRLCLILRQLFLQEIQEKIENVKKNQKIILQKIFLNLIDALRLRWNVVKVPYETQVYSNSELDYPYRGELWIEMIHIPYHSYWNLEQLEDKNINLAHTLWQRADDQLFVTGDPQAARQEWKEQRTRRQFGHPMYFSPPAPVTSPFEPFWCELYATPVLEMEKLPEEITRGSSKKKKKTKSDPPANADSKDAEPYTTTGTVIPDDENGIRIVLRLKGDVGAALKQEKSLRVNIIVKDIKWVSEDTEKTANEAASVQSSKPQSDRTAHVAQVDGTGAIGQTESKKEGDPAAQGVHIDPVDGDDAVRRIALSCYRDLENVLMVVQRTCVEMALFAIIQGQAMRALRNSTAAVSDDESTAWIYENRLKDSVCTDATILHEASTILLELKNIAFSAVHVLSRPSLALLPASWAVLPASKVVSQLVDVKARTDGPSPTEPKTPAEPEDRQRIAVTTEQRRITAMIPYFIAVRKKSTLLSIDSEGCVFTLLNVPILSRDESDKCVVLGHLDLIVVVEFSPRPRKKKIRGSAVKSAKPELAPVHKAQGKFMDYLHLFLKQYLEPMAVCKLRQTLLEVLQPLQRHYPALLFDLHHLSFPFTRSPKGASLLSDFQSWLVSQVATSLTFKKLVTT